MTIKIYLNYLKTTFFVKMYGFFHGNAHSCITCVFYSILFHSVPYSYTVTYTVYLLRK